MRMMPVRGKERDRKKREEVGVIRVVVVFYVWINPNSLSWCGPCLKLERHRKLSCSHGVQSDVLLDNTSELNCRGHVKIREPSVVVSPVIFHSHVCSKTAL